MTRYAAQTTVTTDKTKAEIERTLTRYGATQFAYGWDEGAAIVGFRMRDRNIRYRLPLPDRASKEITHTESGIKRTASSQQKAYEQVERQRWRALALIIKAKLEAVAAGVTSFEDEFLSATMLPDGSSVGEWAEEQIGEAIRTGQMPDSLPGLDAPRVRALRAGS